MSSTDINPALSMSTFGDNVNRARKARSLSRAEVAKQLGSSAPVIGRYERGEMSPRLRSLQNWLLPSVFHSIISQAEHRPQQLLTMTHLED